MKFSQILLVVLLSAAVAFGVVHYAPSRGTAAPAAKETAYERVMRTGKLRCGYYVFPPVVMRDPNTGEMSGFTIDMMNAIAAKTGIEIEWTEESTFGNWIPALQTNRYDVMCAPMWPDMALGREVIFTRPLFFAAVAPIVQADDTRFDGPDALDKLNQPDVTIVGQDGNMILFLAKEVFPKAKHLTLAANVDAPSVVQNVVTGKADAVLLDRNAVIEYAKKGLKLKMVELKTPLKAQAFAMPMQHEETELREFLDNAVMDLLDSGTINRLLNKWEPESNTFLRAAPSFVNLQ